MTTITAFREGVRRVNRAPAVLLAVLLLTFLVALPLGLTLRGMLQESLGDSTAGTAVAAGFDYDWWTEFSSQAKGIGTTFTPGVIGFAAVLENLSAVLDNRPQAGIITGLAFAYLVLWVFLAGGILDRYARNRATRAGGFFAASGVFFFRFLRLAIIAGLVYWFLFAYVHAWLLRWLYGAWTHDFTVERNAFFVRVGLYGVFGLLLIAVNALFDYAKVRAVVEDRRSMIGALVAALRFVRRNLRDVFGLYLLDGSVFVVLLVVYAFVAPGAGPGWPMWLGVGVSQAYILARIWVKLLFYASETALFQQALAHAEYTAAPAPVWPESPAAEAIAPDERRAGHE
jgi:hypothetical protein